MSKNTRFLSLVIMVVLAGASVSPACAANHSAAATNGLTLREVVVTAQKQPQFAQTTPISMQVFTSGQILRQGIVNFQSLSMNDPSLGFESNAGEPYLTIRGVSSSDTTEIGNPAVAVVVDGFTQIRSYSLDEPFYDIHSITVMKGPQGVLYGRDAIGGVIKIETNRPVDRFEAGASAEIGNFNTNNFTGYLNIPLSKTLWLRFSGASRRNDGYINILPSDGVPAGKGDSVNAHSGRVQMTWRPSNDFTAWLLFQDSQNGGSGTVLKVIPFINNPNQVTHPGDISHNMPPLGSPYSFPTYGPNSLHLDDKVVKWRFSYSGLPDGMTLTYLGGYDNMQYHYVMPAPTQAGFPLTVPVALDINEYPKTVDQELRLSSNSDSRFTWIGGLYYFQERSTNLDTSVVENPFSAATDTLKAFLFPLIKTMSAAAYWQGSFKFNKDNSLSFGARYNADTVTRTGIFNLYVFNVLGIPQGGHAASNKVTYHLGYKYSPSHGHMFYATFNTGYKGGGFDTCGAYKPEYAESWELGSKNRFDNDRIELNGDFFYENYQDQQIAISGQGCLSGTSVVNAGGSKIYGVEGAFRALLGAPGKVSLHFTVLHARYSSFVAFPSYGAPALADCPALSANGFNCQLSGNMLPQAPNVAVSVSYEKDFSLPDNSVLSAQLDDRYQTSQYFSPFNYGDSRQPGYGLMNGYLTYSRHDWSIGLYCRNLLNKAYLTDAEEYDVAGAHAYLFSYGAPRTYGVQISANM